ncbi:MAG TPA: fibronectin type III domain-containing protein [archaeon]|nr:fibronectin type III domain-containing protein [archaeon]
MPLIVLLALLIGFPLAGQAESLKLPVVADCGISNERGHLNENSGASVSVPIRQNQNWSGFEAKACLMRFDTGPLTGMSVSRAWLNIFLARGDLYAVGLCTVLADWDEGRGVNGQTGRGGASWRWAREPRAGQKPGPENYWSWEESGIYSVSWAHPDARYHHAGPGTIEKRPLDDGRIIHLRIPVDPKLVESLGAGLAGGLLLTDDKGQVAEAKSLKGTGRPYRYDRSQDIYLYTREIQEPSLQPFLEVEGEKVDQSPPGGVGQLKVAGVDPFDPSVTVSFTAPADDGESGGPVLGYDVRYSRGSIGQAGWESLERLPLWAVVKPESPGTVQSLRVFTLAPGTYFLALRAVDESGNLGPVSEIEITVPEVPSVTLPVSPAGKGKGAAPGGVVFDNSLEVWACPDLCKVDPVTGGILLDSENYEPAGDYKLANQVWSSAGRAVSLQAARGEVVAFQLVLGRVGDKKLSEVRVSTGNLSGDPGRIESEGNVSCFRVWYLDVVPREKELTGPWELIVDKGHKPAWHGDACLPLGPPFETAFDLPSGDNMGDDQRWQSVWVDICVPPAANPGLYQGELTVTSKELVSLAVVSVKLEVLPLVMPDEVTWPVELNAYHTGIAGFSGVSQGSDTERYLEIERRIYQLIHPHRATLNILPYGQAGDVPRGNAPVLKGSGRETAVDSWEEWDSRYGPYLSGEAFTPSMDYQGPRAGVPVTHIYLPFNEDWPMPIEKHYADYKKSVVSREDFAEWAKTSRPLEEAFDQDYQDGFVSVVRQFFEHFKTKGYTRTSFQVYFNNKYYYKTEFFGMRGGVKGSSFWLLDEPVDYDDYAANRFFLSLVKKGYEQAGAGNLKLDLRTDVSQPEMSRGLWDGICNLWNSSGLMDFKTTAAYRMHRLPGENYWRYGGETRISGRLMNYQQNFFTVWAVGASGALGTWNVLGGGGDWFRPDDLSIIYQGKSYARTSEDYDGAFAGVRLKAIRRAQQDVEYLNLLAAKKGWSRNKVRRAMAAFADNPEESGLTFDGLTADRLFELRRAVAKALLTE